ncbi:MAG: hypothetical protein HYU59_12040 [Magnetospirillum gryphiswaldense]|nr:hypothetical protein [Magnetospirillum gryphiswaldense]
MVTPVGPQAGGRLVFWNCCNGLIFYFRIPVSEFSIRTTFCGVGLVLIALLLHFV